LKAILNRLPTFLQLTSVVKVLGLQLTDLQLQQVLF